MINMGFWGWFKSRALLMIENFIASFLLFLGLIIGYWSYITGNFLNAIIFLIMGFVGIIILAYNYYRIRHRGYLERAT